MRSTQFISLHCARPWDAWILPRPSLHQQLHPSPSSSSSSPSTAVAQHGWGEASSDKVQVLLVLINKGRLCIYFCSLVHCSALGRPGHVLVQTGGGSSCKSCTVKPVPVLRVAVIQLPSLSLSHKHTHTHTHMLSLPLPLLHREFPVSQVPLHHHCHHHHRLHQCCPGISQPCLTTSLRAAGSIHAETQNAASDALQ